MNTCDDGRCPLNRQGVPHEVHGLIENRPVKNPCNDPRCAMIRMGIKHEREVHNRKQLKDVMKIRQCTYLHNIENRTLPINFETPRTYQMVNVPNHPRMS